MANWYAYNGFGDPLLASSYRLMPVKPLCVNGCHMCAILLDESAPIPSDLSSVLGYIYNALATCMAQPAPPSKAYVYMIEL